MKHNQLPTLILGLCLCIVPLFNGCKVFSNPTTAKRVQSAAKVAALVGTTKGLEIHPEWRPEFEAAVKDLQIIETAEHIDFATLLAVIQRLPIKELRSKDAQLIITSTTILLSDYVGALPVEKLDELKPLAGAIRQGIQLALGPN